MRSWFDTLDERERMLVIAGGVVIVLALFWFGLWKPLDGGQALAAARVDVWRTSLAELRPLRGQLGGAGSGQPVVPGQEQSLVVIVDGTLRQRGLHSSLERSQPSPSGDSVRVEFDSVSFDDLMLWLGDVNQQYGLLVESGNFALSSAETPGRVNASLTLAR